MLLIFALMTYENIEVDQFNCIEKEEARRDTK